MARIRLAMCVPLVVVLAGARGEAQDKSNPIVAQVKTQVKDPAKPFTMIVSLEAKEGTQAKFETAFAPAIRATLKEKGCIRYELNRDARAPTQYLLYERWQDLPSLEAHLQTAHITSLLKELGDLLAGPPQVRVLLPAGD